MFFQSKNENYLLNLNMHIKNEKFLDFMCDDRASYNERNNPRRSMLLDIMKVYLFSAEYLMRTISNI